MPKKICTLKLDLNQGDEVQVGEDIRLKMVTTGKKPQIQVNAPASVDIRLFRLEARVMRHVPCSTPKDEVK